MEISKIVYNGKVLVDLTADTVTPENLAEGVVAHTAAGEKVVGLLKVTAVDTALDAESENPISNKAVCAAIEELKELIKNSGGTETIYLEKTFTATGSDAWLDENILTIMDGMTKLRITVSATGGGGMSIKAVTASEPWTTSDGIVKFNKLTAEGESVILSVQPGLVRPIFNYYSGSEDSVLTIKCEGTSKINQYVAVAEMPAYVD